MLQRMRDAGLIWPTLATIAAFLILLSLGFWQWQRMHWKRGLLDRLEAAASAAPVPLEQALQAAPAGAAARLEALRYRRVRLRGTFLNDSELHVWAPEPRQITWQVITPLRFAKPLPAPGGGAPFTHALVICGVVPAALKSPETRAGGQPAGPVDLTARIRLDEPNPAAPAPNLAKAEWFTRDLGKMVAHLKSADRVSGSFAPFFLEAVERTGGDGAPVPRLSALTLSNRHFEYALTWWGLAATLIAVFAAFASSRLRPVAPE